MLLVIEVTEQDESSWKKVLTNCPNCDKKLDDGKLFCNCWDDVWIYEWQWKKEHISDTTVLSENGLEVVFHPIYSSGTAAIIGNAPFLPNMHYYWEIKMISNLYGTDVMVGVGSEKMAVSSWKYKFCSLLGINEESWGYSYHGNAQHNGVFHPYGKRFELGSVVGVHLDTCTGTLEYFLNRKSLGIAFRGLRGKTLYPMISSTAAQSVMKINCAVSCPMSLQIRCLQEVVKRPSLFKQYEQVPGLKRELDSKYFWIFQQEDAVSRDNKTTNRDESIDNNPNLSTDQSSSKASNSVIKEPFKSVLTNNDSFLRASKVAHFYCVKSKETTVRPTAPISSMESTRRRQRRRATRNGRRRTVSNRVDISEYSSDDSWNDVTPWHPV